jgi:hypothetical protein
VLASAGRQKNMEGKEHLQNAVGYEGTLAGSRWIEQLRKC